MENDLVLRGHGDFTEGRGGAVYIAANSTFTMSGGTITGASVPDDYGGGVYANKDSTFLMKGGIITGNHAQRGAGVCVREATFTMSGGSIESNGTTAATLYGGGLFIYKDTATEIGPHSVLITGGTITGNKADTGGGLALENVIFTMEGGTIAGNQAVVSAGGIRASWTAQLTINDGVISGNTTGGAGGGIYIARENTSLTVNGGTILGNTAGTVGGGVCVSTVDDDGAPSFTLTGGTLAENQAATSGGGVYIEAGGVFTKQPAAPSTSSGVIYGFSADNPSSNKVLGGLGIMENQGHAVYVSAGPKARTKPP